MENLHVQISDNTDGNCGKDAAFWRNEIGGGSQQNEASLQKNRDGRILMTETPEIMDENLKAPFVYFGGKGMIAARVWSYLGDVKQYIKRIIL